MHLLSPAAMRQQRDKLDKAAELNRTLRKESQEIREALQQLARATEALQRRAEQLASLRAQDATAGEHLSRFASIFESDRVRAHVRAAVEGGEFADAPWRHLRVPAVFPSDVYDALAATLPDPVFFEPAADGSLQMAAPPRVAPLAAIVMWRHVVDEIVKPALMPAVAARLQLRDSTASFCTIRLRNGSAAADTIAARPNEAVTLTGQDAAPRVAVLIEAPGQSAVAVFGFGSGVS
jgi:hypothetical protein